MYVEPQDIAWPLSRNVDRLFWHCSASDRPEHDDVKVIDLWHRKRGWSGIGYHLFVHKDGRASLGRDWNATPSAQAGHNTGTLAFCLHGLAIENFTHEQRDAMRRWASMVVKHLPEITQHGHCEISPKACPVIDYKAVLGLDGDGRMRIHPSPGKQHEWSAIHTLETLRIFDRGEEVKQLQKVLNRHGAYLTVDGLFGRATSEAVKRFQRAHSLYPDGIVGPLTWSALVG